MDEVKHVLVERDILTAVKTPWLVKLLYAFQDVEHVYLAMVRSPPTQLMRLTYRNTSQEETLGLC